MPASGPNAARLARMRATQARYLPDRCTIKRPAKTKTATGGTTDTLADFATNVPCDAKARVLREVSERDMGGQIKSSIRWIVVFAYGQDVRLDDQLWITPNGSSELLKIQVIGLLSTESWDTATGIEGNRIQ